jgi:hypothetical protein
MAIEWLIDKQKFQGMTASGGLFSYFTSRDELLVAIDSALDTAHAAAGSWATFYALQQITQACERWLFKLRKQTTHLSESDAKLRDAVTDLKHTVAMGAAMRHRVERHVVTTRNIEFDQDPWEFAQNHAIRTMDLMPTAVKTATNEDAVSVLAAYSGANALRGQYPKWVKELGDEGVFDLETTMVGGTPAVDLRIVMPEHGIRPTDERGLTATWLPYKSPGLQPQLNQIPRVTLKKYAPVHTLMFTGAMNGCSLVVTQSPDKNAYWVFHDSVHDRETFAGGAAGQVLLRLDYEDSRYTYSEGVHVNSFNFLYFEHGQWYLVCQPQVIEQFGGGMDQRTNNAERAKLNPNKAPFRVAVP